MGYICLNMKLNSDHNIYRPHSRIPINWDATCRQRQWEFNWNLPQTRQPQGWTNIAEVGQKIISISSLDTGRSTVGMTFSFSSCCGQQVVFYGRPALFISSDSRYFIYRNWIRTFHKNSYLRVIGVFGRLLPLCLCSLSLYEAAN